MTITAKFPATCPTCGGAIAAGDKIEWQRGTRARHTACPDAAALTPAPRRMASRRSYSQRSSNLCLECRTPLTDFDSTASAVPGYHFDCA